MYLEHWGLDHPPFQHTIDSSLFFESASHDEALARLHFLAEYRHPVGMLTGPSGSGKTLLLRVLARRLSHQGHRVAFLSLAASDLREAWWQLANGFELMPSPRETSFALWRQIQDALRCDRFLQRDSVILVDDLDLADGECILGMTQLAAMNRWPEARSTVVLAGSPDLRTLAPRLVRLAELRIELETFTLADTQSYLRLCLQRAGRELPCFTNAAVTRLHELTGGVPRRINQLAELALVAAASQRLACVDTETVVGAAQEMAPSRWQIQVA